MLLGMDVTQVIGILTQAGFPTAVALFLLWQMPRREAQFNDKIAQLEKFHKDTLLSLVERNADLLGRNQDVLERCINTMDSWEKHLEKISGLYYKASREDM